MKPGPGPREALAKNIREEDPVPDADFECPSIFNCAAYLFKRIIEY
jgi:hypothetical protein